MVYVDIQDYPTVWCAISNRIRIYDAITWDEQSNDLKTNDRIVIFVYLIVIPNKSYKNKTLLQNKLV